jgi:K+-sensing histidine kinase KdpD
MIPGQPLPNENERLAELLRYEILDTDSEADFDEIVKLAAYLCKCEIALITLLDNDRQWFKAKTGVKVCQTPRSIAFCGHAIHNDWIMEIPDATLDERFHDNPLVTGEPKIRFYAGQPIKSISGYNLGTLCVIDSQPKKLTKNQRTILKILAKQVERQLELRLRLKELEQSFQLISEQKKSLENLNQIKDQTLSVLTHDLRSPLANLDNLLELFDQEILEVEEAVNLIQEIRPNIKQINDQLEGVLNWAKEQVKGNEVKWETFLIDKIVLNCLNWVSNLATKKGVKLESKIEENLEILGDKNIIEIILRNLLHNAIKFTCQEDTITLFVKKEGDKIKIGVRDTGLGISPENMGKIINYNGKLSTLGTGREKGTGLGLILCNTFLTKINSKLIIENNTPKGCSFSFLLPKN